MKKVLWIVVVVLLLAGCSRNSIPFSVTLNGLGRDTENVGRWVREVTQPSVDKSELKQISSAIDSQNRIMLRGQEIQTALGK